MGAETGISSQDADTRELLLRLAERGYRGCIVSIQRLAELREDIKERYSRGSFDEEFYRLRLAFFEFKVPETLPEAKSIIVVAVPRPQAQATFVFGDEKTALILPPTYAAYQQTKDRVAEFLTGILKEKGYKTAGTALPLKLLAVRSGLAEYGRNNISYISSFGSFFQLVALYSDLPCSEDSWREAQMMKQCENCQACRRSCPTGAISSDRFLLHADRCIVFHNEKKGDVPFPSWIDSSWHNCLYGCLHCQRVCPEDRHFMNWIVEREEFSQEETELLLKGARGLSSATLEKLKNLDLADPDSLDSLPRNLRAFFWIKQGQSDLEQKHIEGGERIMSEMIAYCGLDCKECKAFKATLTKDIEWKKQIAKHWMEELKVKFKPEDVDCNGCKSDMISGWCRKICKIRPCAREKKVRTCAHCDNYSCDMLEEFLSTEDPVAAENLEKIRKTLES